MATITILGFGASSVELKSSLSVKGAKKFRKVTEILEEIDSDLGNYKEQCSDL